MARFGPATGPSSSHHAPGKRVASPSRARSTAGREGGRTCVSDDCSNSRRRPNKQRIPRIHRSRCCRSTRTRIIIRRTQRSSTCRRRRINTRLIRSRIRSSRCMPTSRSSNNRRLLTPPHRTRRHRAPAPLAAPPAAAIPPPPTCAVTRSRPGAAVAGESRRHPAHSGSPGAFEAPPGEVDDGNRAAVEISSAAAAGARARWWEDASCRCADDEDRGGHRGRGGDRAEAAQAVGVRSGRFSVVSALTSIQSAG